MQTTLPASARAQPDSDTDAGAGLRTPSRAEPVVLSSSLVLNGELKLAEPADLVITGHVVAESIRGVRKLTVSPKGYLRGNVGSITADIAGRLEGLLEVEKAVLLRRTATLAGEVKAESVYIEEGANLEGSVLSGSIRGSEVSI